MIESAFYRSACDRSVYSCSRRNSLDTSAVTVSVPPTLLQPSPSSAFERPTVSSCPTVTIPITVPVTVRVDADLIDQLLCQATATEVRMRQAALHAAILGPTRNSPPAGTVVVSEYLSVANR